MTYEPTPNLEHQHFHQNTERTNYIDPRIYQLRTLNNQLVRMVQDPAIKVRQGALEYNAYVIKNLLAGLVNE